MRKVETVIGLGVEPKLFVDAFVVPEMLTSWWGVEKSLIELKPGGIYSLVWEVGKQGFGYAISGIIESYNPDKLLSIENLVYFNPNKSLLGPMSLRITARDTGNFTECYLCQDGYQNGGDWEWYYRAVSAAWPEVIQKLGDYLKGISAK